MEHAEPSPIPSLPAALPPGSDWVLHLRPRAFFAARAGQVLADPLHLAFGLAGFEKRFGRPLAELDELVIGAYQGDRVYLVRGADDVMLHRVRASLSGHDGAPGQAEVGARAVMLEPGTLLVRDQGPASSVVEAIRRGRQDPLLGRLLTATAGNAPCALLVAQPLALPPGSGIGQLLQRQAGLALSLRPQGDAALLLDLLLLGHFPEGADRNARQFFASVASDTLGQAIGMPDALPSLEVTADPERIQTALTVDSERLATVISLLASQDSWAFIHDPEAPGSREAR